MKLAARGEDPLLPDAMVLSEMARTSLEILDCDLDGFFLVIEGGAVDWAMHGNQFGRMIEEYAAFDDAVREVDRFLSVPRERGATWANTLVIVTADHDHLLLGPDSGTVAFQELAGNGAGKMAGYRWHSDGHSNRLVPLFVRGPGSAQLLLQADEIDAATMNVNGEERGWSRALHAAAGGGARDHGAAWSAGERDALKRACAWAVRGSLRCGGDQGWACGPSASSLFRQRLRPCASLPGSAASQAS